LWGVLINDNSLYTDKEGFAHITLTARQQQAERVLAQKGVWEVLYGGAKGGGKTVFGCLWMFDKCADIIEKFKLKPQKYPLSIGFMGRKQGVDFTRSTLETWKRLIPEWAYTIRTHDQEIIIADKVKIDYGGFDRQETINKFNSAEYAYFFIDQAEEITRDEISLLRGAMRLKINGRNVERKGLLTANPAPGWLRSEFIQKENRNKKFVQSLPADNPHLPPEYFDKLNDAFSHRPEMLEAFLYGSWDALEGGNVLVKDMWIRQAEKVTFCSVKTSRVIAIDPAGEGIDETVMYYMENSLVKKELIFGQRDGIYTANMAHVFGEQFKVNGRKPLYVIDSVGMGGPIAARLREMGNEVHNIEAAGEAQNKERYYNIRAEMWWDGGQKFAEGEIEFRKPEAMSEDSYEKLKMQLTTPMFELRNGRVLIEDNKKIRRRMSGKSLDRATAYIMGLYGLRFAVADEERDSYRSQEYGRWRENRLKESGNLAWMGM